MSAPLARYGWICGTRVRLCSEPDCENEPPPGSRSPHCPIHEDSASSRTTNDASAARLASLGDRGDVRGAR